jgi:hypothetical protein
MEGAKGRNAAAAARQSLHELVEHEKLQPAPAPPATRLPPHGDPLLVAARRHEGLVAQAGHALAGVAHAVAGAGGPSGGEGGHQALVHSCNPSCLPCIVRAAGAE